MAALVPLYSIKSSVGLCNGETTLRMHCVNTSLLDDEGMAYVNANGTFWTLRPAVCYMYTRERNNAEAPFGSRVFGCDPNTFHFFCLKAGALLDDLRERAEALVERFNAECAYAEDTSLRRTLEHPYLLDVNDQGSQLLLVVSTWHHCYRSRDKETARIALTDLTVQFKLFVPGNVQRRKKTASGYRKPCLILDWNDFVLLARSKELSEFAERMTREEGLVLDRNYGERRIARIEGLEDRRCNELDKRTDKGDGGGGGTGSGSGGSKKKTRKSY